MLAFSSPSVITTNIVDDGTVSDSLCSQEILSMVEPTASSIAVHPNTV